MDEKIKKLYEEIYDVIIKELDCKRDLKTIFRNKDDMAYITLNNKNSWVLLGISIDIIIFFIGINYFIKNPTSNIIENIFGIVVSIVCISLIAKFVKGAKKNYKETLTSASFEIFLKKYKFNMDQIEALIAINQKNEKYRNIVHRTHNLLYIVFTSFILSKFIEWINPDQVLSYELIISFFICAPAYFVILYIIVKKNEKLIIITKFIDDIENIVFLNKIKTQKKMDINDLIELIALTTSRNYSMENKSSSYIKTQSNADYECENDSFKIYIIGRCKNIKHKYDDKDCPICKKKSFKKNKKNWFS